MRVLLPASEPNLGITEVHGAGDVHDVRSVPRDVRGGASRPPEPGEAPQDAAECAAECPYILSAALDQVVQTRAKP